MVQYHNHEVKIKLRDADSFAIILHGIM